MEMTPKWRILKRRRWRSRSRKISPLKRMGCSMKSRQKVLLKNLQVLNSLKQRRKRKKNLKIHTSFSDIYSTSSTPMKN